MLRRLQSALPLALSVVAVALVLVLSWRKLTGWELVPALVGWSIVAGYLAWLAAESRIAAGELDQDESPHDRGTLELYAAARFVTAASALALPTRWDGSALPIAAGALVFFAGVALRLWAIRVLGAFYSHRVRKLGDHAIVQGGPYQVVRHPAYTGMLLAHAGFVFAFWNPISGALLAFLFVPAVVLRIRIEERMLYEIEGYRAYAADRKRLLPWLW
jgi:protein-S-isoprenylcysteine O-methyltransferase Ste14